MLNVNEVRNLENSWKKYKRKKYLLYLSIFGIFVVIALFFILFFYKFNVMDKNLIIKNDYNISNKHYLILNNKQNKKKSHVALIKEKNIMFNKKNKKINHDNNLKVLSLNTNFLNHIYTNKNISKKNDISKKIIKNKTTKIKNKNIIKPPRDKNITKKQTILISSKKLNRIDYYKEKYFDSGKIIYANLIAQIFYDKAKYKESLKWAIIANDIDSSNEESWILFAKDKVKIGQKQDAINALEAYLKFNKSKKLSLLLSNIKNGVIK